MAVLMSQFIFKLKNTIDTEKLMAEIKASPITAECERADRHSKTVVIYFKSDSLGVGASDCVLLDEIIKKHDVPSPLEKYFSPFTKEWT